MKISVEITKKNNGKMIIYVCVKESKESVKKKSLKKKAKHLTKHAHFHFVHALHTQTQTYTHEFILYINYYVHLCTVFCVAFFSFKIEFPKFYNFQTQTSPFF